MKIGSLVDEIWPAEFKITPYICPHFALVLKVMEPNQKIQKNVWRT